jgi:hypothetical protein
MIHLGPRPIAPRRPRTAQWPLALAVSMMSIGSLMMLCDCALLKRKVVVIPADKEVKYLAPGQSYQAPTNSGMYLVPPARMQEILRALAPTNS